MNTLTTNTVMQRNSYGGKGGDEFARELIRTVTLNGDVVVDRITINDHKHGGTGGKAPQTIILAENEYFNEVTIRYGAYVDYLELKTNLGQSMSCGNINGGDYHTTLTGIRIVSIGGRCSAYLDNIEITYVSDYEASTTLETASFILDFAAPNTIMELLESETETYYQSYERSIDYMISRKVNASIESEFIGKASLSTEIETKYTEMTEIKTELTKEISHSKKTKSTVDKNQIQLMVADCIIMKWKDYYWIYPVSTIMYPKINLTEIDQIVGRYALPGVANGLKIQIKNLDSKVVNGFDFLEKKK